MLHLSLPIRRANTIVIGAGPTGLAASYLLQQEGIAHVLLEQSQAVASSWRTLWDNYKLAMTAENIDMPGVVASERLKKDQHPTKDEMIAFFEWYAKHHQLPIQYGSCVFSVIKTPEGLFEVRTNQATYLCENVVCCIGPRHQPKYPFDILALKDQPSLQVLHSRDYRSCKHFDKQGKVLVVGSGAGALSIAYDILKQGYTVGLACGRTQAEIVAANKHLYESSDREVVPSLDFLVENGIINHGRLQSVNDKQLVFDKAGVIEKIASDTFKTVIFATGYERSFKLLKDMLPSSIVDYTKEDCGIPGLYIAGIPGPSEQTVIISQGSQQARVIVKDIVARKPSLNAVMPRVQLPAFAIFNKR